MLKGTDSVCGSEFSCGILPGNMNILGGDVNIVFTINTNENWILTLFSKNSLGIVTIEH